MGSMCLQLGLLSASGADGSGGQRRTRLGWIAWVTWQSLCLPFSPSYHTGGGSLSLLLRPGGSEGTGSILSSSDVVYSPLLKLMLCLIYHYVKGARTSMCVSHLRCILVLPTPFRVSVAPPTQPVDS